MLQQTHMYKTRNNLKAKCISTFPHADHSAAMRHYLNTNKKKESFKTLRKRGKICEW